MSKEIQHHNCPHCGKPIRGYCSPKKPLWWDVQQAYERGETIQYSSYNNYGGHAYWNAWVDWKPKALGHTDVNWDYFNAQTTNGTVFRIKPEGASSDPYSCSPIDVPHWSYSPVNGQMEEWPERCKGLSHML